MSQPFWYLLFGVAGGLILAHVADVFVAAWQRFWRGEPTIGTHFSPKGGCTAAVVSHLASAKFEVLLQVYSFTSKEIANALIAAANRGVRVCVLLDQAHERETREEVGDLADSGIEVLVDVRSSMAHNTAIVIDGRTVLTGSFHFTEQAEHESSENLLILRNHRDLARRYRANFQLHRDRCRVPGDAPIPTLRLRKAA